MKSSIFSDMLEVLMPKKLISTNQLTQDTIFDEVINETIEYFTEITTVKPKSKVYHVSEIVPDVCVGYVIANATTDDYEIYNQIKTAYGSDMWYIDKRIISKGITYYVTVMFKLSMATMKQKQYDIEYNSNSLVLLSKSLDYVIDCIHHDSIIMSELAGARSDDALVILAKTLLLFSSSYGRKMLSIITEEDVDDYEKFHMIDAVFLPLMKVDWLMSKDIKLEAKAHAFESQIMLKQDIYNFCKEVAETTTLPSEKIMSIDVLQFKQIYNTMFNDGKIISIVKPEHKDIVRFIVIGHTNPYSTKTLNTEWEKISK